MPKNIVIFSDGTGQAGGLKPDQNLSNIYKLYRAARPGPESPIDPTKQVAFYDAGLGTDADAGRIPFEAIRKFRKLWSGATGSGISRNITDCYAAIVKHYEPGDRIFLFGFSRGAYTARCVGGVLSLCGVPTQAADSGPVPRHGDALRQIANEAVQKVYEHGSGTKDPLLKVAREAERMEQGRRFRAKYGSNDPTYQSEDGQTRANTVPYFIGVFDTVAALGAPRSRRLLMGLGLATFVAVMAAPVAWVLSRLPWVTLGESFAFVLALVAACMLVSHWRAHYKVIRDFPTPGSTKRHLAAYRFRFYDKNLNARVRYARHALAIDETRADFDRVQWGSPSDQPDRTGEPEWMRQVWFAGNHSDIGGSYPEDESRLSDISLGWMLDQVDQLPNPLIVDRSRLHLFPDAGGMQHCEIESARETMFTWLPKQWRPVWAEKIREIPPDAPLHPTVMQRYGAAGVSHYGLRQPYRPPNLAAHQVAAGYRVPTTSEPIDTAS